MHKSTSDWRTLWSINEASWQRNQYDISIMLSLSVCVYVCMYGLNVRGIADWHVVLWANVARVLSGRFKADYHGNKSFNLCSKAFLWNWRLSIFNRRKREVSFLWSVEFFFSFFFVQVRLMAVIRQHCEAFKRFSDMDFLQIRVINFSGHLMRARWKEKEGDALRSRSALMSKTIIALLLFDI